ncbi:MAG: Riboflavin biosynthesis protein RibD [Pedosphaera sp.]|nr:Riboflavin biosynthesis protein RibD [Pedosphaera sp.]
MSDTDFMQLALRLARRGYGTTSPNPMVGAVLVKRGKIIGRGWHHRAGMPHAEIEALRDAEAKGNDPKGATLYVTLEPCSTHGRTPPCTDAIIAAGIKQVVVGTSDPNPAHAGKGFGLLRRAGVEVMAIGGRRTGRGRRNIEHRTSNIEHRVAEECARHNETFNHWIVHRTPFVSVKAAMTLDGKIATARGESKWITGEKARAYGMKLRQGADAILVGVNTVLLDDPGLTPRIIKNSKLKIKNVKRRIVLDSQARTPLEAKVVSDGFAALTTIVVSKEAPEKRVSALMKRVNVLIAPTKKSQIDLRWLMKKLGAEDVTSLLVEGGGEVNASFLLGGFAHRVAFFYAPKILGGRDARKGVGGEGIKRLADMIKLRDVGWRRLGEDLLLTGRVV